MSLLRHVWAQNAPLFQTNVWTLQVLTHPIYFPPARDRPRASSYSHPPRSWTDCTRTQLSPEKKVGKEESEETGAGTSKSWQRDGFMLRGLGCRNGWTGQLQTGKLQLRQCFQTQRPKFWVILPTIYVFFCVPGDNRVRLLILILKACVVTRW